MGEVIEIHRKRSFSLEDARALLPVIKKVTTETSRQVELLGAQLSYVTAPEKKRELEASIRDHIQEWYTKIRKLGCESKGIWLVDFDNGEGYYCWNFPEEDIEYFHGYHEGFQGRVKIH